jgi:hypothetical protein
MWEAVASRYRRDYMNYLALVGEPLLLLLQLLLLLLQQLEQQLKLGSCERMLAQHLGQAQQKVRAGPLKSAMTAERSHDVLGLKISQNKFREIWNSPFSHFVPKNSTVPNSIYHAISRRTIN